MRIGVSAVFLAVFAATPAAAWTSAKAKARGAELFATRGCAHCHGKNGVGGGRGPDLQQVRKRLKAEQIARQIRDGGKSMPAFGDDLAPEEIKDLVAFLRAKRKAIVVERPETAATTTALAN